MLLYNIIDLHFSYRETELLSSSKPIKKNNKNKEWELQFTKYFLVCEYELNLAVKISYFCFRGRRLMFPSDDVVAKFCAYHRQRVSVIGIYNIRHMILIPKN